MRCLLDVVLYGLLYGRWRWLCTWRLQVLRNVEVLGCVPDARLHCHVTESCKCTIWYDTPGTLSSTWHLSIYLSLCESPLRLARPSFCAPSRDCSYLHYCRTFIMLRCTIANDYFFKANTITPTQTHTILKP